MTGLAPTTSVDLNTSDTTNASEETFTRELNTAHNINTNAAPLAVAKDVRSSPQQPRNVVLDYWRKVNRNNPKHNLEASRKLAGTHRDLLYATAGEWKAHFKNDRGMGRYVTRYGQTYKVYNERETKILLGPVAFNKPLFDELARKGQISRRGLTEYALRQGGISKEALYKTGTRGQGYNFQTILQAADSKKYGAQIAAADRWIREVNGLPVSLGSARAAKD